MSEITPDFKQSLNPSSSVLNGNNHDVSLHDSSYTTALGVDLTPVAISSSLLLWRIELLVYANILVAATIAIAPFFFTAFYWVILWLSFACIIAAVLRQRWCAKQFPAISLRVQQQVWYLQYSASEYVVVPFNEILLWSAIIILPLQESLSGRKHRIVILKDSMRADEWRCLRVWLRTGLKYKH